MALLPFDPCLALKRHIQHLRVLIDRSTDPCDLSLSTAKKFLPQAMTQFFAILESQIWFVFWSCTVCLYKNSVSRNVWGKKDCFPKLQWENILKTTDHQGSYLMTFPWAKQLMALAEAPWKRAFVPKKSTVGSRNSKKKHGKVNSFNKKIQTRIQKSTVLTVIIS